MLGGRSAERGEDDRAGDPVMSGDRQGVTGVVIEPGEDLAVLARAERVMGEVGLPHLVGLVGLEAGIRRTGPLRGRRRNQTLAAQRAVDRRSRHSDVVVVLEMPADRVRAGIKALRAELAAQPNDQRDGALGDRDG